MYTEELDMDIRNANKNDMEKIKDLLSQVLLVHHKGRNDIFKANVRKYNDAQLAEILENDQTPVFVAQDGNLVVGYAFCVIKQTKDNNILQDMKTLYIDDLCVDENARHKHVGKSLFEYVKNYAKTIGCYNLTLNVWECNTSAKAFYEKMGLLPQKTIMETIL